MKNNHNIFKDAQKHPKALQWREEAIARIRLAEKVYKARTELSLSMAELAEKAHTTAAVISRIENAQVSAGIDLIFKIFKALGKKKIEFSFS